MSRVLGAAGHRGARGRRRRARRSRCCREHAPDVLVVDLAMCERDRRAVLDAVKARRGGVPHRRRARRARRTLEPRRRARALRRGAQDFLVEPVRDAELLARVQAAGRTKVLQEELVAQTRRLEPLLYEDPLTGLHNRRFILTQLARAWSAAPAATAARSRSRCVDLDHFKARQRPPRPRRRRRGARRGRRARCAARLRAEDQLGRLGGEEFLALLPDTGTPRGRARGRAPARGGRRGASRRRSRVTVSVGWATLERRGRRRPRCGGPTRRSTPPRRRAATASVAPSGLLPCPAAHDA